MKMKATWSFRIAALAAFLTMSIGLLQAQSNNNKSNKVNPTAANGSVKGSGTVDHISKWVGDGQIGDSMIVENDGEVSITGSSQFFALYLRNPHARGNGLYVEAGGGENGGWGMSILGGNANLDAGLGLYCHGGNATTGQGGFGVFGVGGNGGTNFNAFPGVGVYGAGGNYPTGEREAGVVGFGFPGIDGYAPFVNGAYQGLAGRFNGDVLISGTLSAATKNFKIDHPLDPENKYLYHTSVESPDMMNIYNGNLTTDENGEASVTLPDYFEALNSDFRYQLTVIGTFAQAIVTEKIKGNRFKIKTSAPGVEVSWQVTGIRRDAWASKNRIKVEEYKPERERGSYLHPEAFNQPERRGVGWAHDRAMMRRLMQTREMREKNQR
jgi:hypothetical protein